ncbi:MAG: hypothetical protein RR625_06620, partial [Christensenellaceae bacterium]
HDTGVFKIRQVVDWKRKIQSSLRCVPPFQNVLSVDEIWIVSIRFTTQAYLRYVKLWIGKEKFKARYAVCRRFKTCSALMRFGFFLDDSRHRRI